MNETRQRILATAGQLFAERGYGQVGVNEIIDKAGVAKATFYSAFKSKDKLCAEWLRSSAARFRASDHECQQQNVTPAQKVADKFASLRNFLENSGFRGCMFSNTASLVTDSDEITSEIRGFKATSRAFWQSLASDIHADQDEARVLGDTLFLLYSGATTEAQNQRSTWPVDSACQAASSLCESPKSPFFEPK